MFDSALKEARRQAIESLQPLIRSAMRSKGLRDPSYGYCLAQREASRQAVESLKHLLCHVSKHKRT